MAKGIAGSYGKNTGGDTHRQPSPPQSETPGRGVMIDPNTAEYSPVTGSPGRYYTPDRSMTVGIGRPTPTAPLSEQPGRGILASPTPVGTLKRFPSPDGGLTSVQPMPSVSPLQSDQRVSNFGPVGDIINRHQMTAS